MTGTLDLVSVTSADLLLSLLAPRGWEVRALDEFNLGLFSDVDDDGHRANITFTMGEPEEPGTAWFERFGRAAAGQLAATLDGYEELGREEFRLSSRARVVAVTYRQHAEGADPTSHLQAYVWADSYRMYVVNGATRRETEERDLPLFEAVLRSIRVLPPRT